MKRILPFLLGLVMATGCQGGWLNPSQPGFVIQTFTSYDPISGNNSGTILTNGNSYQFAGDNTGWMYLGGPGVQFRGINAGTMTIDAAGAAILGDFAAFSMVTNHGKGSLILGNLSVGQTAYISPVANASLVLGAATATNSQAIVVGDGNVSHGHASITAGSFWGDGSSLTLTNCFKTVVVNDVTNFPDANGSMDLSDSFAGSLANTDTTSAKITVGALHLGLIGDAAGLHSFAGGSWPIASNDLSFVWDSLGTDGGYGSHGQGTFNINPFEFWIGENEVWDYAQGFVLPVPVANIVGAWTNPVAGLAATAVASGAAKGETAIQPNSLNPALVLSVVTNSNPDTNYIFDTIEGFDPLLLTWNGAAAPPGYYNDLWEIAVYSNAGLWHSTPYGEADSFISTNGLVGQWGTNETTTGTAPFPVMTYLQNVSYVTNYGGDAALQASLAAYLPLAGGQLSGNLGGGGNVLSNFTYLVKSNGNHVIAIENSTLNFYDGPDEYVALDWGNGILAGDGGDLYNLDAEALSGKLPASTLTNAMTSLVWTNVPAVAAHTQAASTVTNLTSQVWAAAQYPLAITSGAMSSLVWTNVPAVAVHNQAASTITNLTTQVWDVAQYPLAMTNGFMTWAATNADAGNTNNWFPKRLPTRSDMVYVNPATQNPTGTITCAYLNFTSTSSSPLTNLTVNGNTYMTISASPSFSGTYNGDLLCDFTGTGAPNATAVINGNLTFLNNGLVNATTPTINGNLILSETAWASQSAVPANLVAVRGTITRKATGHVYYGNTNAITLMIDSTNRVMYSPKTATAANEVVNFQTWTNNLNFMVWNGTNADAGNTNNWTPKRLPTRSDNVWFPAGASSSPTGTINCATFYAVANAPTPASAGLILNGNVMQTYGASGFGYTEICGDVWASNTTAYSFGSSGTKVYGNTQLRGGMYGYSSALFCGDVLMQTNSFDRQISNAGITNFKGRVQVAELGTVYWPGSSMGSSNIMFNMPARMMTASNIVSTNLTFGGYAVSWKTNTWWAYATSNATEKTAYTNTYLGR